MHDAQDQRSIWNGRAVAYLLETPSLADLIEEGLDQLGYNVSAEETESRRGCRRHRLQAMSISANTGRWSDAKRPAGSVQLEDMAPSGRL